MKQNKKKPIAELIDLCLPILTEFKKELKVKNPSFIIEVGESSIGSLTSYQGHHVYLECYRHGYIVDEPNCVVLEISLKFLNSDQPIMDSFGVYWGGDGTPPEQETLDLLTKEIPWNEIAIERVKQGLPKLKDNLSKCLKAWNSDYPKEK
jgi:hypothetical protein